MSAQNQSPTESKERLEQIAKRRERILAEIRQDVKNFERIVRGDRKNIASQAR